MLPTCNYTSKMALVCGVMGADVLMPTPCVFQGGSCTASLGTSLRAPPSSWSCEKKRQKEGQKKALSTSPRKKTFYSFSFHRCNQIDHIFIPSHISCLSSLQRLALEGFLSQLVRCQPSSLFCHCKFYKSKKEATRQVLVSHLKLTFLESS